MDDINTGIEGLSPALRAHVARLFATLLSVRAVTVSTYGRRAARVETLGGADIWIVTDRGNVRCIRGRDANRG